MCPTVWHKLDKYDLLAVATILGLSLLHASHFNHVCDDAFISFRYADNLVRGHGLVFNAGERVMGYSNLLWVLLLAALQVVGIGPVAAAKILGTLLAWGTLLRVYAYLRETCSDRLPAIAATLLLATWGTFAMWIFGGLEGPLLAFLLLGGVIEAMRMERDSGRGSYLRLGLWFGLAGLTRPEGVFYSLPVACWLLVRNRGRSRVTGVIDFLVIAWLFYIGFTTWAFFYYGDPLPNAYYAKMHPLSLALLARGWSITEWFLRGYLGVPLLIVLSWAAATRLRLSSPGWFPLGIIATFLVFFVRVGGDALVYYRMWFWTLPMFALLAGEALAHLTASGWRYRRAAAVAVIVLGLAATLQHSFFGREIGRLRRDEQFVRDASTIADALRQTGRPVLVAANNVGAIAYGANQPFVDMLGLNDRHIARAPGKQLGIPAHESHDGSYVLDRRPDLIFYGMPRLYTEPVPLQRAIDSGYPSDLDLMRDPRFRQSYALTHLRVEDGRYAPVFARGRDR